MTQDPILPSGTARILAPQVLSKVVGFFFLAYVARVLGVSVYGTYAFIVALIGMLSVLADFGLNTITIRTLSRDPGQVNALFWANIGIRVPLWAALVGLAFGILAALDRRDLFPVAALFLLGVVPVVLGQVVTAILNGLRRFAWISTLLWLSVALPVAAGYVALRSGYGIAGLAIAGAVASSVQAAVGLRLASAMGVRVAPRLPGAADLKRFVLHAFPLGLSLFFVTVYYKIDRLLIALLLGDVYVGWYDVAYRFLDGLMVLPVSVMVVVFPLLSRVLPGGPTQAALDAVRRGTRWMFALGLPLTMALSLMAFQVVTALFGSQYAESARVLRLLVWAAAFMFPNAFLGNALVAADKQHLIAVVVGLGVIANVALNLMLIPWLGIDGAAIATIAAEAWGFFSVTYFLGRHLQSYAFLRELLRPAAVAGVIGGMILILDGLSFVALAPLVGLVYLAVSFLFRALDVEDVAALLGFRRRLGRAPRPS